MLRQIRRREVLREMALSAGVLLGAACASSAPAAPTSVPAASAGVSPPPASPAASPSTAPAVVSSSPVLAPSPSPSPLASPQVSGSAVETGVPGFGAPNSWVWAAADGGYFEQYGINVDLTSIATSTQAIAALISGETPLDAGMTGSQVVASTLKGADTVIVAVFVNTFPSSILSQPGITTTADLKGKTVGVNALGDAANSAMDVYLTHVGMSPSDVSFIPLGGQPQVLAALEAKQLDVGILSPPVTQTAQQAGFYLFADIGALGIQYAYNTLATTRSYLASHRDVVQAALQACIAGCHRLKTDKTFGEAVLQKWTQTTDQQSLDDVWTALSTHYLSDYPAITNASIQAVIDEIALTDPSAQGGSPPQMYDASLLAEIQQAGFFQTLGIATS